MVGANTRMRALCFPNRNPNPVNTLNTWLVGVGAGSEGSEQYCFRCKTKGLDRVGCVPVICAAVGWRDPRGRDSNRSALLPNLQTLLPYVANRAPLRRHETRRSRCAGGTEESESSRIAESSLPTRCSSRGRHAWVQRRRFGDMLATIGKVGKGEYEAREVGGFPAIWRPGCLERRPANQHLGNECRLRGCCDGTMQRSGSLLR